MVFLDWSYRSFIIASSVCHAHRTKGRLSVGSGHNRIARKACDCRTHQDRHKGVRVRFPGIAAHRVACSCPFSQYRPFSLYFSPYLAFRLARLPETPLAPVSPITVLKFVALQGDLGPESRSHDETEPAITLTGLDGLMDSFMNDIHD